MSNIKYRYFVSDFETTVYDNQDSTEVWASAIVELYTENVHVFHSIDDLWFYLTRIHGNLIIYYHNLSFDGSFWLNFLLRKDEFSQAYIDESTEDNFKVTWIKDSKMKNNTYKYTISSMGQWYEIRIRQNNRFIILRDSYKLLPFSVKSIGKSFETKHKKLDMTYEGYRYAGCEITDEEKAYIKNDVLVIKEAMEIMMDEGNTKMTIGSCCLSQYKTIIGKDEYNMYFKNLTEFPLDKNIYPYDNADKYIRKSYKGGICYVNPKVQGQMQYNGITVDVNSLYPSMMHSKSGNIFPVGNPYFWSGDYIPDEALRENKFYFLRVKCSFHLKPNRMPTIQLKNSWIYNPSEWLSTSDIMSEDGKYHDMYIDMNGKVVKAIPTMTLSCIDWNLLQEHYYLDNVRILDGCWFYAEKASVLFDTYVNRHMETKMNSTGAKRQLAKLYLNNLYGKFGSSDISTFNVAHLGDDGALHFRSVEAHDKRVGYIPIACAITSYARRFTIKACDANMDRFCYCDTDSMHLTGTVEDLKNVELNPVELCTWKHESSWKRGFFSRQKTYIEEIERDDKLEYNIKCAGMSDDAKELLLKSITQDYDSSTLSDLSLEFVKQKRDIDCIQSGLEIPERLKAKQIKGGVLLVNQPYAYHERPNRQYKVKTI